jgi:glucoamylase
MLPETWASGVKQGFGTAYGYSSSKTWFTLSQGALSEAYWPQLDEPQIKDSQFLVTGENGLFWEERTQGLSEVQWVESGVPSFYVRTNDALGRFWIEKWIWTEVSRNVIRMRVIFHPNQSGLRLFVLHNPTAGGTPMSNSAAVSGSPLAPGEGLFAWDGNRAQAWVSTLGFKKASASFSGPQDLFQDLQADQHMDHAYTEALDGNVVLGAELSILEGRPTEFEVALSFAPTVSEAHFTALSLLRSNWSYSLERYAQGWRAYQSSVRDLSRQSLDGGLRFRASVALLKAMEDKLHPGAVVAAPTVPWGFHQKDESRRGDPRSKRTGGYHLIWPRDLYMMATTWMAIEDYDSARAAFFRLKEMQYDSSDGEWKFGFRRRSKDGSFAQNMWIDGEPYWQGLQLDETAFPVILAYRLWKAQKLELAELGDMAIRASDFIADFGPWSGQERWEESFGASPSTIASQIAALYCGAELARATGDLTRAHRYQATADAWSLRPGDNIEAWTFTRTGGVGDGHYFVRVEGASRWDQVWNPNDDELYWIANGGPQLREKDVLDGGFLELVRLGVRGPLATSIQDTLGEYDSNLGVLIPGRGMGYYRYTGDHYGYDERTGQKTRGMLWPLLTGERGHYALAAAREASNSYSPPGFIVDQAVLPYIAAMESFATPSFMMPEQVWDGGPEAGLPTGAATPLGWTHAEYIKLLRSREMGDVFDRVPLVFERTRQLWRQTH